MAFLQTELFSVPFDYYLFPHSRSNAIIGIKNQ